MPPRMTTRSAGRSTAALRGGRTRGRTGRGSGRTIEPRGRGDGQTGEPNDQGVEANEGVDGVHGDVRNVIVNNGRRGCSYKAFLAYNPKEYDRKGVAATEPKTIQKAVQKVGTLTDEAIRNGSLKRNLKRRGNGREPSRDRNVKDDNKRTRTGNAFATTANPVRREYTGTAPKVVPRVVNPVNARNPTAAHGECFECGGIDHFKAACLRLNQAQRPGGNRPNQDVANNEGQGHGNNDNQARGRAFMLGAQEARQDPNIMTGCGVLPQNPRNHVIIEKSQLDFANEDPPQTITERSGTEDRVQDGMAYEIPPTRNASTTGFSDLQVSNNQLAKQVVNLQAQVTSEEKIKAAFEEFKKYEDDKVEQRCAEMDARLDKLSVDFDEELHLRMWCSSAGPCKGRAKALKYMVYRARRPIEILADIKAYDPEANSKLVKALQDLKDLKYPMVDQLERLKDALMELIMASLHLNSDTGKDALNPWAVKEEMLLEDAIAANISRAKKKKKCRVVCHAHGIGSAHHARSDGYPCIRATVVPGGSVLLCGAATPN
ncbi:hypothetical protein Tco_0494362 [Tanacetum coccineum]